MKLRCEQHCNVTGIEFKIENKGDANWWRIHSKSSCEYGVRRKKKLKKDTNLKRHLSLHKNELNKFQFEIAQSMMMTYGM